VSAGEGGGLLWFGLGAAGVVVVGVLAARRAHASGTRTRREILEDAEDQDYESVDADPGVPKRDDVAPGGKTDSVPVVPAPPAAEASSPAAAPPSPATSSSAPPPAPSAARTPKVRTPKVPPLPAGPPGYLTHSIDRRTHVTPADHELLEQARRAMRDPSITLDELAGARLAASEYERGTLVELACIVDAEVTRAVASRRSLYQSLTRGAGFGRQGQGSARPASTARDPKWTHLWAARAVLSGAGRGIARGAVRFFDPEAMDVMHARWKAGRSKIVTSCDALSLLEAWSFDRPRRGARACPFDPTKTGPRTQAWVGPIDGVNAWRLMLMRPEPAGPVHLSQYLAAAGVITADRARAERTIS